MNVYIVQEPMLMSKLVTKQTKKDIYKSISCGNRMYDVI